MLFVIERFALILPSQAQLDAPHAIKRPRWQGPHHRSHIRHTRRIVNTFLLIGDINRDILDIHRRFKRGRLVASKPDLRFNSAFAVQQSTDTLNMDALLLRPRIIASLRLHKLAACSVNAT